MHNAFNNNYYIIQHQKRNLIAQNSSKSFFFQNYLTEVSQHLSSVHIMFVRAVTKVPSKLTMVFLESCLGSWDGLKNYLPKGMYPLSLKQSRHHGVPSPIAQSVALRI